MVLASLAAAVALAAWLPLSQVLAEERGFIGLLVSLAGAAILGGGAFFLTAYLLKVHEVRYLPRRALAWGRDLVGHTFR
jgi:hypothetical protein